MNGKPEFQEIIETAQELQTAAKREEDLRDDTIAEMDQHGVYIEDVLEFFDDLRESGVTNMFGAGSYLTAEFGFSSRPAGDLLTYWMTTFGERHPRE